VLLLAAGAAPRPSACSCGVVTVRGGRAAALLAALLAHTGKHETCCEGST